MNDFISMAVAGLIPSALAFVLVGIGAAIRAVSRLMQRAETAPHQEHEQRRRAA